MEIKELISKFYYQLRTFNKPYVFSLRYRGNEANFYINSSVEEYRIRKWGGEKEYINEILEAIGKNGTFLDIGASIGLITVLVGKLSTKNRIISFEPDPDIAKRLVKNIKLNNLKNVEVEEVALGSKNGQINLFTKGADDISPSTKMTNNNSTQIRVKSYTLDSYLKLKGNMLADVVKIDVEGAEYEVLRGARYTLSSSQKPKHIFVEIHGKLLHEFGSTKHEIMDLLEESGYKVKKFYTRRQDMLVHYIL